MALQVCTKCSTRYAPAAACPHCGGEEWIGELEADGPVIPQELVDDTPKIAVPGVTGGADDAPADYTSYPMAVLRELAKERGITQHGAVKADLAAALAQWDAEHPAGDADAGDDVGSD